jgi:hypothetical protein
MPTGTKEARTPGPGPVEVDIVAEKIGHERAFVVPGRISTGKGETKVPSISWKNHTKGVVRVWFPFGGRVFEGQHKVGKEVKTVDESYFVANTFDIPSEGTLTLFVKDEAGDGTYHYHVYCEAIHESAQGNSEPEVVVP